MPLPDADPLFYVLAIIAVILLGLSKGGFFGLGVEALRDPRQPKVAVPHREPLQCPRHNQRHSGRKVFPAVGCATSR